MLPELKFNFKSVVKLSKNEINAEKIEKALKYYKDNKFITFDLKKLNPKEKPLPHYEKPEGSTNINDGKNPTIPPPAPAIVNGK